MGWMQFSGGAALVKLGKESLVVVFTWPAFFGTLDVEGIWKSCDIQHRTLDSTFGMQGYTLRHHPMKVRLKLVLSVMLFKLYFHFYFFRFLMPHGHWKVQTSSL